MGKVGHVKTNDANFRGGLVSVTFYLNNKPFGMAWRGLVGGAYLVGHLDQDSETLTDRSGHFLYPDLTTVIAGRFADGRLVSGSNGVITQVDCDDQTGILKITKTDLSLGPCELRRDVSTNEIISKTPLIKDTFEMARVEVRESKIPGSGEGLYAKMRLKPGEMVALFNGVRQRSTRNSQDEARHGRNSDYRIRLNGETDIDIPDQFKEVNNYCATLGHKANHSFEPNARWSRLEHPRFGLICAITAVDDIDPDQEILVNYGMGMADAPSWYKSLWVQHLRDKKGLSDGEILDWCGRHYAMTGKSVTLPNVSSARA